jgi:hypothetical protein
VTDERRTARYDLYLADMERLAPNSSGFDGPALGFGFKEVETTDVVGRFDNESR